MPRTLTEAETKAVHHAVDGILCNATDTYGQDYDETGHVLNNRDEVLCAVYDSGDFDHWTSDWRDDDVIWAAVVALMSW